MTANLSSHSQIVLFHRQPFLVSLSSSPPSTSMDLRRRNKKIVRDEIGIDFVERHDNDVVFTIFSYLDDIAYIHRASAVSRLWRRFVLNNANGLYQKLCFRKTPGIRAISTVEERRESCIIIHGAGYSITSEFLESRHKLYSSLLRALSMSAKNPQHCIKCVLGSSSTNRYPDQSIVHILVPTEAKSETYNYSYWSSRGMSDSNRTESILLQLDSSFCIVTEIDIQAYKALLEPGSPIYSPRFVRFQMGHPKLREDVNVNLKNLPWQEIDDNKYAWNYTSPEFPVIQEDSLQRFKLPEPLICVGGILKIELLGSAQRNELDGLYYTCINHVTVLGHPLSPAFEVTVNPNEVKLVSSGDLTLTFCEDDINRVLLKISQLEDDEADYNFPAALQVRRLKKLLFPHWHDPWGELD